MMESERVVIYAEEDRISNLPEHLIDLILERVPVEDAVHTSILSRKWRYKWTKMRALVFDEQFSNKFAKKGDFGLNGFIRIITQILILHEGSISKFQLYIPNIFLGNFYIPNTFQHPIPKKFLVNFQEVNQWVKFLSRKGVRELILTNLNLCYELPCYMFSCLELTKLMLENCFFKPPIQFEGFPNLEELCLTHIDFAGNMCGTQINLPKLMNLSLVSCTNVYNFNIKAPKLQTLVVLGSPDAMLLRLFDSPCLCDVGIAFFKPIQDSVWLENMNLVKIFSKVPRVVSVNFDGYFLKFLVAEKIPKMLPRPINSLKDLGFIGFQLNDLDQLYGALCMLRSSPNLEKLNMVIRVGAPVDLASNHLESPNCLDCTLNQLQTVEIDNLQGSRAELLFIKLLLAHSPSLEKITITPSGETGVQKRRDIAKDVMQFSRASTKAKIFYLDPKP